jgi:hypothetical protein
MGNIWIQERYEHLRMFMLYEPFYTSKTIHSELTVAIPWQQSKILYCCQRYVAKQYKGKAPLRLQGSIFKFIYIIHLQEPSPHKQNALLLRHGNNA